MTASFDVIIARQHAMYTERDIVMANPSVRPSVRLRLRNDLYCVQWDVKLYYTVPSVRPSVRLTVSK